MKMNFDEAYARMKDNGECLVIDTSSGRYIPMILNRVIFCIFHEDDLYLSPIKGYNIGPPFNENQMEKLKRFEFIKTPDCEYMEKAIKYFRWACNEATKWKADD